MSSLNPLEIDVPEKTYVRPSSKESLGSYVRSLTPSDSSYRRAPGEAFGEQNAIICAPALRT